MESERWKKASLAISSIIRGLELDQVEFHYDEAACGDITDLFEAAVFAPSRFAAPHGGRELGSELRPM
jgi:hypothetical protein